MHNYIIMQESNIAIINLQRAEKLRAHHLETQIYQHNTLLQTTTTSVPK